MIDYRSNHVLQEKGFDIAKMFIKATFRQVQAFINTNTIRVRGGYLIAHVPEVSEFVYLN